MVIIVFIDLLLAGVMLSMDGLSDGVQWFLWIIVFLLLGPVWFWPLLALSFWLEDWSRQRARAKRRAKAASIRMQLHGEPREP